MNLLKEQLLRSALALNGEDKKFEISVEDDKIITRVKWMDATFFSPGSVTDEMREFEYIVKLDDNGKYSELDKSVQTTTSFNGGGFGYNKKGFIGKSRSFNKTIGVGKNNNDDEIGIIDTTFYSEEYKEPVRNLLKNNGYKKKMGHLGKIFIGVTVISIIFIALILMLLIPTLTKEPIGADKFEKIAESKGYALFIDEGFLKNSDKVKDVRIAADEKDDYQIEFVIMNDTRDARLLFNRCANNFENLISAGSQSATQSAKYEKFSASDSDFYTYVARIKNTVVCVKAPVECKDEIKEFLKEIGY